MSDARLIDAAGAAQAAPRPRVKVAPRRSLALNRPFVRTLISIVVVALAWEVVTRTLVSNRLVIVPLSEVANTFLSSIQRGRFWDDVRVTFMELLIAFAIAGFLGIVVGVLMAISDAIHDYLNFWVSALYATPTVAVAPLFIIWFGLGIESKIAVAALLGIFPVIVNTEAGIRTTDRQLVEAARSFQATDFQIFRKVLIPSALPFIVAGLRLAVGRALVGVVVAEFFGSRRGLGNLILSTSQVFDTATLFMAVIILASAGALLVALLSSIEQRLAPWRKFEFH
jgi:ABC-type nitrate/sulfonate/bicarbonate transport system permease component